MTRSDAMLMTSGAALAVCLVALGSSLGAGRTSGAERGAVWEYGELTINRNRAVLVGEHGWQIIDGPLRSDREDPLLTVGRLEKRLTNRYQIANIAGLSGWEIVTQSPILEDQTYQVRRMR